MSTMSPLTIRAVQAIAVEVPMACALDTSF
jgi:hypothetical protein